MNTLFNHMEKGTKKQFLACKAIKEIGSLKDIEDLIQLYVEAYQLELIQLTLTLILSWK
ncbi:MAG: hypothetical protein ACQEUT_11420 [Bacillota bacterium]